MGQVEVGCEEEQGCSGLSCCGLADVEGECVEQEDGGSWRLRRYVDGC